MKWLILLTLTVFSCGVGLVIKAYRDNTKAVKECDVSIKEALKEAEELINEIEKGPLNTTNTSNNGCYDKSNIVEGKFEDVH